MSLLVLAQAEAQQPLMPISALFDSMATVSEIHQGPIGFGGSITPRGLWLERLVARRSEWFHMDSLSSSRPTTRVVTVLSLDLKDEEQLFTAYAKTMGDTSQITFGRGCVFTESVVGDFAAGQIMRAFTVRKGQEQQFDKRIARRMDSMLLASDNIAGRGALLNLQELYRSDSVGAVNHLRRVYGNTNEAIALRLILQYGHPKDSTLLIERLALSDKKAVTEALDLYDAQYANHLKRVEPLMLQLAPQYATRSTRDFYMALVKALMKTPLKEGEEVLSKLEAVLTAEQQSYYSWIENVRASWEE